MLVQMKTIEFDHFSDFFGVANDLRGNQRTALSSTSISRILDIREDTFHDQMPRAYMPAAQKRVGFEREKKRWGRNLPRLRENIVLDYVMRSEICVVRGTDRALRTLYNSDRSESHKIDTLLSAQGRLEFRRREEFTECCDLWMRSYFGWILEEGIADGLELRVHTRIFRDVFENIRLLKLCSRRLQTAHRYQDFKDRTVAIVESLGQEAIRGSTTIAVHGVQLSPPATPAVPHFSRGYDPKRLLIVLQSPYEPMKASISSKSSKGRKGSMNQGWIQRRVFYYPSTSGTCIRREIVYTLVIPFAIPCNRSVSDRSSITCLPRLLGVCIVKALRHPFRFASCRNGLLSGHSGFIEICPGDGRLKATHAVIYDSDRFVVWF
ncbi:hypothetical protein EDD15DRAFT_2203965 [Pisolithus albus]|nr:hypothetical protein EDD15DRAFT_2203965 [Pisolithus albus]